MSKYAEVSLEWFEENGQLDYTTSKGTRFCTQIRFIEEGNKIPQWTAEIIITKSINKCLSVGNLRYLFEHAPNHLLKKGSKFIVFDGPYQIAKGEVLADF